MDTFTKLMTCLGVVAFVMIISFAIAILLEAIKCFTTDMKRKFVIRHRFDKQPTAKCYCVDCKYWNEQDGCCSQLSGWRTADSWFCWKAEPVKEKL